MEDDTHSPVRQLESTTTAINSFTLEWSDKQHANPVDEDINLGNLRALQVRCVPPNSIDAMPNDHQSIVSPPNLRAVKMEHGAHVDTVCRNSATAEDPKATPVQQCAATQDSRAANAPFNPGTAALDAAGPALAPGEAFGSRIDVALLVVKNEEISASAAELCPSEAAQVASLSPRSQSCHRYSHGLFSRDECESSLSAYYFLNLNGHVLKDYKPQVVVGSGAAVKGGALRRIPLLQLSSCSLRRLIRFVDCTAVSSSACLFRLYTCRNKRAPCVVVHAFTVFCW